jgi:DNA ligase (NAD+)
MMENQEARNARIRELEQLIPFHQSLYYNGRPRLSDQEFDILWDELSRLSPENPVLSRIGADASDGFPKARHVLPMGSQAKASDPEEFLAWCRKVSLQEFVVEYKLDGASLELQYAKGRLVRAVTRGDGTTGDDITQNAVKMAGVPATLAEPFSGAVRGEVVMSHATHSAWFADKANCRNAANGLMKRKDGAEAEKLEVLCYDAAPEGLYDSLPGDLFIMSPEPPFDDELSKIEWLSRAGFSVLEPLIFTSPFEVIDYRARIMSTRASFEYDIDGLVIKARKVDVDDMKRSRPDRQIAFKFPPEQAVTTLIGLDWSESGATYTPVGLLEPVRLAGTTVRKASLANTNTLRGMGLRIGSKVVVSKRGEIIPKIEGLVGNPPDSKEIITPLTCSCGASLVDEGTRLYCPNPDCPKKVLHQLEKWLATLDVMEFGTTILRRLFDAGRLNSIADLYTLSAEELAAYERMGELSAAKIIQNLHARNEPSLAEFIAGFDMEGIGLLMVEKAASAGFNTLAALRTASAAELSMVEGFGDTTAKAIVDGLAALAADMDAVLATGKISIREPSQSGGPLSGQSFCFTGEMESMKRSRAQALVKSLGGAVRNSVAAGLSFLVTNDPASGSVKSRKALSLGVSVLDERAFLSKVGIISGNAAEAPEGKPLQ